MTDKTAIRELREKVEKGERPRRYGILYKVFGDNWQHAYDIMTVGSLDAALALHEAMLPGWVLGLWPVNSQKYGCMVGNMDAVFSVTPARAWLIAILKAMEND